MFPADLGLVKLIPELDKCTLAPTYQCLIGAVHLKALTLASPLRGDGAVPAAEESSGKNWSIHPFALDEWWNRGRWSQGCVSWSSETGAVSLLGGPSRKGARSLALLMEPLGFGRQITSVRGWGFKFCLLSLPISKSGAGVSLDFMLWSLSLILETLFFECYICLTNLTWQCPFNTILCKNLRL